jgi:glycosyltransferase 2 family protein
MDAEHVLTPKTGAGAPKEAAAHPVPATRHQGAERLRSLVLGPRGGGVTRRRASDAVRLGAAIVLVAICIALIRANTSLEIQLTKLLTPPPTGIRWVVSTLWQLGSFGVIAALALLGLVVPRLAAVRQMAIAGLATLGVCLLLSAVLGPAGGRPPVPQLPGVVTAFPVTQLAVAMAVALTGLPFLSRPMHRIVGIALALAALSALIGGYGLPFNIAASIVIGWGMAAACHLAMGSPAGLLSAAEVTEAVRDLRVDVRALVPVPGQEWGEQTFAGEDDQGRRLELAVYGRDASDAQWLTKLWRFLIYRDSGPTLMIHRLQQVEHEAYLTLLAGRLGVLVPEVVAAGRCGPSNDAALVTRPPPGPRLADLSADQVGDEVLDEFLRLVLTLRPAGIAHGALSPETVLVTGDGPGLRDFRRASASAPAVRTDRDLAAALGAAAVVAGVDRVVAAAHRVLDAATVQSCLPSCSGPRWTR